MAASLDRQLTLDEVTRARWRMVGVHLATAFRLRGSFSGGDADEAQAILSPGGAVEHAEGEAKQSDERAALRRAVRAIDRARTAKQRQEDVEALRLWEGMVEGRWSLVDRFDSDGRRYFLAYRNDPTIAEPRRLTERERQVVAYVGQGDTNKMVAYQLGLSTGAVARLLSRAMEKLGVTNREELVWLRQTLR